MFRAHFPEKPKRVSFEPESGEPGRVLRLHPIRMAGHTLRAETEGAEFLLRRHGFAQVHDIPQARLIRVLRFFDDHSVAIHIPVNQEIPLRLGVDPPACRHEKQDQRRSRYGMPSTPHFGLSDTQPVCDAPQGRLRPNRGRYQPEHQLLIRAFRQADSPPYPPEDADGGSRHHPLAQFMHQGDAPRAVLSGQGVEQAESAEDGYRNRRPRQEGSGERGVPESVPKAGLRRPRAGVRRKGADRNQNGRRTPKAGRQDEPPRETRPAFMAVSSP